MSEQLEVYDYFLDDDDAPFRRQQERVIHKVIRLLTALPEDAATIAELFHLQGVRGVRSSVTGCPLSVYFARNGLPGLEVGARSIGHEAWDVELPKACQRFVRYFDRGSYKMLRVTA